MDMENLIREFASSCYSSLEIIKGDQKIRLARNQVTSCSSSVAEDLQSAPSVSAQKTKETKKVLTTKRVGLFYPKVKPGDSVSLETVIGHIKAMNLMHEMKSDLEGVVLSVEVEAGNGVEYGDTVVRLE